MQEKKPRMEKLNNRLLNLPEEIAFEIFYRLPPESIVQCKLVSKSWCSLLPRGRGDDDGNYFANMYLREQRHHQQRNLDYSTLNFIAIPEENVDYSTWNFKPKEEEEEEEEGIGEFHITEYDQAVEELNCPKVKRLINFSDHFLCIKKQGGGKPILVGSCNGLVCVCICVTNPNNYYASSRIPGDPLKDEIGICNPFLHEYVTLPLSNLQFKYNDYKVNCIEIGFGHNPITDEYKVVRVYRRCNRSATGDVEVYTLGKTSISGMWRSKGTINFFGWGDLGTLHYRLQFWSQPSVFINGSIHWLVKTWVKEGLHEIIIVSFNLEDEEFGVIPLPISNRDYFNCIHNFNEIRELRGCLYLIEKSKLNNRGFHILNIWVLKDYMNKESWVKEFSNIKCEAVPWGYSPCAIKKMKKKKKDGHKILFWFKDNGFVSYDPRTQNLDEVVGRRQIVSKLMYDPTPVLHINSFVSLKALGEDAENHRKTKA